MCLEGASAQPVIVNPRDVRRSGIESLHIGDIQGAVPRFGYFGHNWLLAPSRVSSRISRLSYCAATGHSGWNAGARGSRRVPGSPPMRAVTAAFRLPPAHGSLAPEVTNAAASRRATCRCRGVGDSHTILSSTVSEDTLASAA